MAVASATGTGRENRNPWARFTFRSSSASSCSSVSTPSAITEKPERVSHRHDCRHELAVLGAASQIGHEGAIDLQLLDRESLEVGKSRIAGAEVVHRQAHAQALDPLQRGEGVAVRLEQHALRDLERQAVGVETGGGQRL